MYPANQPKNKDGKGKQLGADYKTNFGPKQGTGVKKK
jgi:hypothetical protein